MKKIVMAFALLLLLAVAAPWITGRLTEHDLRQTMAAIDEGDGATPLQLMIDQYDRGYFSSHVRLFVRLRQPGQNQAVEVPLVTEVEHGVLGTQLRVQPDLSGLDDLQALFPDRLPTLTMHWNFWGKVTGELDIPGITLKQMQGQQQVVTQLKALSGRFESTSSGDWVQVHGVWQGLALQNGPSVFLLGPMQWEDHFERSPNGLWSGQSQFDIGRLQLLVATPGNQGPGNQGPANQPTPLLGLQGLRIGLATWSDRKDRASVRLDANLEQLHAGQDYGPHQLKASLIDLDLKAWSALVGNLHSLPRLTANATAAEKAEQQMKAQQLLFAGLREVFFSGMQLRLDKLQLVTTHGLIDAQGELFHPELLGAQRQATDSLLKFSSGSLDAAFPKALIDSRPDWRAQVDLWLEHKLVTQVGEQYHLKARLRDMQLLMNGQSIAVPPLF